MSNTIEPTSKTFAAGEQVSLEVALEDGWHHDFTWVILSIGDPADPDVMVQEVVRRSPKYETLDYSLTATALPPGGYHLRLYAGAHHGDFAAWSGGANLEAEDSFAVVAEPATAVYLTQPDAGSAAAAEAPFATFAAFQDAVRRPVARGKGRSRRLDPRSGDAYGTFGGEGYLQLKRAAVAYAQSRRCASLADLIPPGYLEERAEAEPLLPAKFRTKHLLPCVELIWNYWQEEGMLVQTLNVILARFENRRVGPSHDPLARFDVTPLLPLRNLLWGFAEDEVNRLTLRRRAAEYEYEYGLTLIGRAVPPTRTLVERRTGFLESFHQILHQAHVYYKERDDLTVNADAFPLYRSLRECHLILSQGSHNQYGEMAIAARAEFLTMQHLLAQPQMREFLGGRPMTPYPEPWMDRVDTMKNIQGWTDTSVMHHHDLATLGERLVLTIRIGNWADTSVGAAQARVWADAFRPAVQKYTAAYRAVTGVDLSQAPDATMPSTLIARRLQVQRRRA